MRALDARLTYRQVQMMSKHGDPKTAMRYDRGRESREQNAVNPPGTGTSNEGRARVL